MFGANRGVWQAAAVSVALHVGLACALAGGALPQGHVRGVSAPDSARLVAVLSSGSMVPSVAEKPAMPQPVLTRATPSDTTERHVDSGISGTTVAATSEPAVSTASRTDDGETPDPYADYFPAQDLDIIPMPVSAPDSRQLDGMVLNEVQVGVKLYIDASGQVRQVAVAVPDDEQPAAGPLRRMFENTAFVPGRKGGKAVASVLAIQIGVQELGRVRHFTAD